MLLIHHITTTHDGDTMNEILLKKNNNNCLLAVCYTIFKKYFTINTKKQSQLQIKEKENFCAN